MFSPANSSRLIPSATSPPLWQGLFLEFKMSAISKLVSNYFLTTRSPSIKQGQFLYFFYLMIAGGQGQDLPMPQVTLWLVYLCLLSCLCFLMTEDEQSSWSCSFLVKMALMKTKASCPTSWSSSCMYTTRSLGSQYVLEYSYYLLQSESGMFSITLILCLSRELAYRYWQICWPPSQLFKQQILAFEQF